MAAPAVPEKTELFLKLSCRNLISLDLLSPSDPVVFVEARNGPKGTKFEKAGRTELLKNQKNPDFKKEIELSFLFEETQYLRFTVVDVDDDAKAGEKLKEKEHIGRLEVSLGDILRSPNSTFEGPLLNKKAPSRANGSLIVSARKGVTGLRTLVNFQCKGVKLDKKDVFGKSDPYLVINRKQPTGGWQELHKTEVIKNTLDPFWAPFKLSLSQIVDDPNNLNQEIKIDCFDWDARGKHDVIGHVTTTLQTLFSSEGPVELQLLSGKGKPAGKLHVGAHKEVDYGFLDFIQGGMEINLVVGVDFTASNGLPHATSSLHYIHPEKHIDPGSASALDGGVIGGRTLNQYQSAIVQIGDILSGYATKKSFPAFGFGASCSEWGKVNHCFALNWNEAKPECEGVAGVLDAYTECLKKVQLHGPTNFTPILERAMQYANTPEGAAGKKYLILLMITDGEITDLQSTVDAVVQASYLPMSIIIIGVGNENFKAMEALDSDKKLLKSSKGQTALRDCVQFVAMEDFKKAGKATKLAATTLKEIPDQLLKWMKAKRLEPLNAKK